MIQHLYTGLINNRIKSAIKMKNSSVSSLIGLLCIFIALFSCDRKVPEMTKGKKTDFPNRSVIDANILFKDSGRVTMDMRSPLIEEYSLVDSPYWLFPKGVDLDFYEKGKDKPGYFQADWARLSNTTGLYEGKGNVIIVNDAGDSLKTEQLFWNKTKKLVFTSKEVYLISHSGDSLTAKNGLQASDDLQRYTLFNNKGYILVDDNQKF